VVDRDRVDQLLALLARYVRILRELAEVDLDQFIADPRNYGSAERFLQLAIECTLSVGHHLASAEGLEQPTTYAEVYDILGRAGILEPAFAARPLRGRLVPLGPAQHRRSGVRDSNPWCWSDRRRLGASPDRYQTCCAPARVRGCGEGELVPPPSMSADTRRLRRVQASCIGYGAHPVG